MQPTMRFVATLFAAVIVCSTLSAATLEWSYPLGASKFPYQVFSDGAGGCGVVIDAVDGGYSIVWLDKSGNVRYNAGTFSRLPVIITCQKNTLVFCFHNGRDYQVNTVDKKGTVSPIVAVNVDYFDYPALAMNLKPNPAADAKGFFVTQFDKGSAVVTLQRYSYK